ECTTDLDDEHHRIADHAARVELAKRVADGAADDRSVEQRACSDTWAMERSGHESGSGHGCSAKCSTIGPSASAGTNDSAPTSSTTPTSSATNSGPVVGSVPDDGGTIFFLASEPAIASTGMTIQ